MNRVRRVVATHRTQPGLFYIESKSYYFTTTRGWYSKSFWLSRSCWMLREFTAPDQLAPQALNGSPAGAM